MGNSINKLKIYCKNHQGRVALIALSIVIVLIATIFTVVFVAIPGEVKEISVKHAPNKLLYYEGEEFDAEGLQIIAKYSNGKKVEVDGCAYDIHKPLKVEDTTITISYKGSKTTIAITVLRIDVVEIVVKCPPNKLSYYEGEVFDTQGLIVEAKYNNGETQEVGGWIYDIHKPLKAEDNTITISYGGKKTHIAITVLQSDLTEIVVKQKPDKLSYIVGEVFDTQGLIIEARFNNGQVQIVEGWTYDIHSALDVENTVITVSYCGTTVNIAITVALKQLDSIEIAAMPQKLSYKEGEYFDFLGIKLMANYQNYAQEEVYDYQWDITRPLVYTDTTINIIYTLNSITKSSPISITVEKKANISVEQEQLEKALEALPSIDSLTIDDLDAIDYTIELLAVANELTIEQAKIKVDLENKRKEIISNMPPVPEREFTITYAIADNLLFEDMSVGNNPTIYKNSQNEIMLENAASQSATARGYVFVMWQYNNQAISSVSSLTSNITIYAVFELTETVVIEYVDYFNTGTQLVLMQDVMRRNDYNLLAPDVEGLIYQECSKLPIAYYNANGERITSIDLSRGAVVTIAVIAVESRQLHLSDDESATLSWVYNYMDNNGEQTASISPQTNKVFVAPIGAEITLIALHANISDIIVDGISKGEPMTSIIIKAMFQLEQGANAVSITFSTVLQEATTISFVGKNQQEIVYPAGWNGVMSKIDLDNVAFVYNENDLAYLNIYTIDGIDYHFDDLSTYVFSKNTSVWVNQIYNSFSLKIIFANGQEAFNGLIGRQTLSDALSIINQNDLKLLNTLILGELYSDSEFQEKVSINTIMDSLLLNDIVLYSQYIQPPPPLPEEPTFPEVDYSQESFVGTWTSTFRRYNDILSSTITLDNKGFYSYKTYVNGKISTEIEGQYRIDNNNLVLKTLKLKNDYELVTIDDLTIDIRCSDDGFMRVTFIIIDNSEVVTFDHMVDNGAIKPANYIGQDYVGTYLNNGITIILKENGTAEITSENVIEIVYYRYIDGQFWIYSNGAFGTGNITEIIGGNR